MISVDALSEKLRDLRPVLELVGGFAVSVSQKAFDDQEWEGEAWPARYPFQPDRGNFVNVAALLQALNSGSGISSRHFDDRPALLGSGGLRSSIDSRPISDNTVEVGSVLDYASIQNEGGESQQPITEGAKAEVSKLIGRRPELGPKLSRLLNSDELRTDIVGRRFIGVTPQLEQDIAEEVEDWLSQGQ